MYYFRKEQVSTTLSLEQEGLDEASISYAKRESMSLLDVMCQTGYISVNIGIRVCANIKEAIRGSRCYVISLKRYTKS